MLQVNNVCKRYAPGKNVLNCINFCLHKSEMLFLTGHSGAGKSTLLKLIAAIEKPSSGNITLEGIDYINLKGSSIARHRRKMGLIFQDPMLLADRNVFNNVALPLVIVGMSYNQVVRKVRAALDKVGLLDKEHMLPRFLSGGEQQRVSIARAIVNKPPIILADEPTGNLDPELSIEIMNLLLEFNKYGVSMIVATHDINIIKNMHQRCINLVAGKLTQSSDMEFA